MITQYYKYMSDGKNIAYIGYIHNCEFSEHDKDTLDFMQNFANECRFYLDIKNLFDDRFMVEVKKNKNNN